ncbi:Cytochrome P450 89A9-like protein [Drosera capensis]
METWITISLITILSALLLMYTFDLLSRHKLNGKKKGLPPGPPLLTMLGLVPWLGKSVDDIKAVIVSLRSKYGDIINLPTGSPSNIMVYSFSLAHQALVQGGTIFADRPEQPLTVKLMTINCHTIHSAGYGPTWRTLRRNIAEFLHPSRLKSFTHARKWTLQNLKDHLNNSFHENKAITVRDHVEHAMFCLLAFLCFGSNLDENQIKHMEPIIRKPYKWGNNLEVLDLFPPFLTKVFFPHKWEALFKMKTDIEQVVLPLIKARRKAKIDREKSEKQGDDSNNNEDPITYLDTLLELEWDEDGGKRKATEEEMVVICTEFMNPGSDTTWIAMEWIMANLIKYPEVQDRLFKEIEGVMGPDGCEEVLEENLHKIPYLKAVILETLRRHPPGNILLPHAVTEDVDLGGYTIPKKSAVNFLVQEVHRDENVWENPMKFNPERFTQQQEEAKGEGAIFNISGSREMKMMPFGLGRRICPGYSLAMLHMHYFVANLVWNYEWKAVDDVDLSETQSVFLVMKNPVRCRVLPRRSKVVN